MNDTKDRLASARLLLRSDEFRREVQHQLQAAVHARPELQLLIVSTVDGRIFSQAGRDRIDPHRVAALGATLMSVNETLGREIQGGGVDYASLMLSKAVVVSRRIPDGSDLFSLTLAGTQALNMAMALRLSSDASKALATCIERQRQMNDDAVTTQDRAQRQAVA